MIIYPNTDLADVLLAEFNHCHNPEGSSNGGKFCATPGTTATATPTAGGGKRAETRPKAIRVSNLDDAVRLILQGKVVELPDVKGASTVLSKLAAMAKDAEAKGDKAPNYDLCNVSVAGTNLFCRQKVRSKKYPNGVPRIDMPQMSGVPQPGSRADALPRMAAPFGHLVDGTADFVASLAQSGIKTEQQSTLASKLKASQKELVGATVAAIMTAKGYDPGKMPIFVSRDNYVVDGHHRWAAQVGRDASDGRLGDLKVNIIRIDAPISEILHRANRWARAFGIAGAAGLKGK